MAETGATGPWIGFNVMLRRPDAARGGGDDDPDRRRDHPLRQARHAGDGAARAGRRAGRAWRRGTRRSSSASAPSRCRSPAATRSCFKASEMCPATHRLIVETLNGAGLPKGVLNIVTHAAEDAPEVVSALIAHPKVRRINFTGSTRVGRIVAEQAGRHLKPVAARARRQGAARRARRRRPRRRGQRRRLRRLHEPGPDLHVDREDRRRRARSPTTSSQRLAAKARRAPLRRALGPRRARLGRQPRDGRAGGRADRRRGRQGGRRSSPAAPATRRSCRRPWSTG